MSKATFDGHGINIDGQRFLSLGRAFKEERREEGEELANSIVSYLNTYFKMKVTLTSTPDDRQISPQIKEKG